MKSHLAVLFAIGLSVSGCNIGKDDQTSVSETGAVTQAAVASTSEQDAEKDDCDSMVAAWSINGSRGSNGILTVAKVGENYAVEARYNPQGNYPGVFKKWVGSCTKGLLDLQTTKMMYDPSNDTIVWEGESAPLSKIL